MRSQSAPSNERVGYYFSRWKYILRPDCAYLGGVNTNFEVARKHACHHSEQLLGVHLSAQRVHLFPGTKPFIYVITAESGEMNIFANPIFEIKFSIERARTGGGEGEGGSYIPCGYTARKYKMSLT